MARKNALNRLLCNLLALTFTILHSIEEAEGKICGKNSKSGSKTITKKKDSSGNTQCYEEEENGTMVVVDCPHTLSPANIAEIAVGSAVGAVLLFLICCVIKKKIDARRRNLRAGSPDPEDKKELVPPTLDDDAKASNQSGSATYPMDIMTPSQENTFADKFKNALKKSKQPSAV